MTVMEREAHRQRIKEAVAQREADEAAKHKAAAAEAAEKKTMAAAKPCTTHPYLSSRACRLMEQVN